jgi:hypothetical protein
MRIDFLNICRRRHSRTKDILGFGLLQLKFLFRVLFLVVVGIIFDPFRMRSSMHSPPLKKKPVFSFPID